MYSSSRAAAGKGKSRRRLYHLMVLFNGKWGVRRTFPTRRQAEKGLRYEQERSSWTMKIRSELQP